MLSCRPSKDIRLSLSVSILLRIFSTNAEAFLRAVNMIRKLDRVSDSG